MNGPAARQHEELARKTYEAVFDPHQTVALQRVGSVTVETVEQLGSLSDLPQRARAPLAERAFER